MGEKKFTRKQRVKNTKKQREKAYKQEKKTLKVKIQKKSKKSQNQWE